jgi:predicted enzyme related to lactoylglutathione lyase
MTRRLKAAGALACLALLSAGAAAGAAAEPKMYWPPITDPPTGTYTPGKWVWAELLTRDVGRAADFYGKIFGWTFETYGPKDDAKTYTLVSSGGTPIAGMVFMNPGDRTLKPDARWVGLVSVTDVKLAEGRVINAGGKVLMGPRPLGTRGDAALFADPEGGIFGVLHSATGDPDYLGDENSFLGRLGSMTRPRWRSSMRPSADTRSKAGLSPASQRFSLASGVLCARRDPASRCRICHRVIPCP